MPSRVAVFVDAGYLYKQGPKALVGLDKDFRREEVALDLEAVVRRLSEVSAARTQNAPLLRIYWYDGMVRGRLSQEQEQLADTPNVKVRLGVVAPDRKQKGVDSLIVTDLVELARNQAIADAVLLAGDEDLRIGVQIAQSLGVRIHLIGIEPSRGSQSVALLQEADTTDEWKREDIAGFMTLAPETSTYGATAIAAAATDMLEVIEVVSRAFAADLGLQETQTLGALGATELIPPEFDRRLLAICGKHVGRDLDPHEKGHMRRAFRQAVRERLVGS